MKQSRAAAWPRHVPSLALRSDRRLVLLAFAAGLTISTRAAIGQTTKRLRKVGILAPSTPVNEAVTLKPFFEEMQRLGWSEGSNVVYDRAFANDQQDLLPKLAAELVARSPEVIYAPPATAALAAHRATQSIPIVFGTGVDPVGMGLVKSLSRPGGNVTGVSSIAGSLAPKRMQLLQEMMPRARRIGFVGDASDLTVRIEYAALEALNPLMGLTLLRADAANASELDATVERLLGQRVDVVFTEGSFSFNMRGRLLEMTRGKGVPVVGHRSQMADSGALFGYGASLADQLRRSGQLVDKVLRGARPADIPVEQPSVFELVINLKAARSFGVLIPPSLLLRADRVIE